MEKTTVTFSAVWKHPDMNYEQLAGMEKLTRAPAHLADFAKMASELSRKHAKENGLDPNVTVEDVRIISFAHT